MNLPLSESGPAPLLGALGTRLPPERTTPLRFNSRARRLRRRPIAERGARHTTPTAFGENISGPPPRTTKLHGRQASKAIAPSAPTSPRPTAASSRHRRQIGRLGAVCARAHSTLHTRHLCFANGYRPKPRISLHSPTDTVRSPACPAVLDRPTRHPTIRPQEPPTK